VQIIAVSRATLVPADKVLLVANVFGVAVPGAAQNVTQVRLQFGFLTPTGALTALADLESTGTIVSPALALQAISWRPGSPGFALVSGQVIGIIGDFNAGAAANTVSLSVVGTLIPRGNWQRT